MNKPINGARRTPKLFVMLLIWHNIVYSAKKQKTSMYPAKKWVNFVQHTKIHRRASLSRAMSVIKVAIHMFKWWIEPSNPIFKQIRLSLAIEKKSLSKSRTEDGFDNLRVIALFVARGVKRQTSSWCFANSRRMATNSATYGCDLCAKCNCRDFSPFWSQFLISSISK